MEKFFKIGEKIPRKDVWDRLIDRWYILMDKAIERYNIEELNEERKDLPYWYDEGTNVGFLTGAIWLEGGIVFQQLPVDKIFEGNRSKGRGDFLFEIDNFICYVEAKRDKPGSSNGAVEKIIIKLDESKEQLKNIENRNGISMAICFVVPELKSLSNANALNDTNDIFDKIKRGFMGDNYVLASYIPQGNIKIKYEEYYYPGVALVGELIE